MAKFTVRYWEDVCHSLVVDGESKEDVKKRFFDGTLELKDTDIIEGEYIEDTLEIEEEI